MSHLFPALEDCVHPSRAVPKLLHWALHCPTFLGGCSLTPGEIPCVPVELCPRGRPVSEAEHGEMHRAEDHTRTACSFGAGSQARQRAASCLSLEEAVRQPASVAGDRADKTSP